MGEPSHALPYQRRLEGPVTECPRRGVQGELTLLLHRALVWGQQPVKVGQKVTNLLETGKFVR